MHEIESQKEAHERKILTFESPKPDMLQGIQDLFNLFMNGFKEPKFVQGVVKSFISTGCLPIYSADPTIIEFQPYTKHKLSGTLKVSPATSEGAEVLEAMYNMLDYDSDDDASVAMRFILDYDLNSSTSD